MCWIIHIWFLLLQAFSSSEAKMMIRKYSLSTKELNYNKCCIQIFFRIISLKCVSSNCWTRSFIVVDTTRYNCQYNPAWRKIFFVQKSIIDWTYSFHNMYFGWITWTLSYILWDTSIDILLFLIIDNIKRRTIISQTILRNMPFRE